MADILVILACLYFAYSNVKLLVDEPPAQWELVHYVLILVTVALVAVAVLRGVTAYRKSKQPKPGPEDKAPSSDEESDNGYGEDSDGQADDGEPGAGNTEDEENGSVDSDDNKP